MITKLFTKIIGSRNDRTVKALKKIVKQINELEPQFASLADVDLQAKTAEFRQRLQQGEELESLLPEAFATVREASKRVFNMRHFDVQLMGGMVLNNNQIAEMKTGEGKTLTATLPAYLNALTGRGVHIVTVNDYLARRDAEWSRPLFAFLGLTVGCNLPGMSHEEKQAGYACDITYGTNNEFGFDYLRDNMAFAAEQRVQRPLFYALVDEVDSVLIDEARTPLIISGAAEDSSELYIKINTLVPLLQKQDKEDSEEYQGNGHYTVDEKARQAYLTENGQIFVEEWLKQQGLMTAEDSLFSVANITLLHHVNAALRANTLFERDVDYIVKDDEVVIVDEHTGRTMAGRRWSEGLHQAIEAKEGVKIRNENQTLASITFQNYFRLYEKLAGMTGTADTEAYEFQQIYGLDTVVLPTNRPMIRDDMGDLVYLTEQEKYAAIIEDIKIRVAEQRPALVGTISIEHSELLSNILTKEGIDHKVLNAKFHAQEAQIIAQAGRPGAVTIATNMAGRGTDIVLEDGVAELGGLKIIGTERHESRRIDNQLRGRAGRQGDPGESKFYLSLEDDLMRLFGSERMISIYNALGIPEGEEIQHKTISKTIEKAQKKIENNNFGIRKNLLDYDRVNNEQREVMYKERRRVLDGDDMKESVLGMMKETVANHVYQVISDELPPEEWDLAALNAELLPIVPLNKIVLTDAEKSSGKVDDLVARLQEETVALYEQKEKEFEDFDLREIERIILLKVIDRKWMDHIDDMDQLREGIGLQAYGQRDPVVEYRMAGFEMFNDMTKAIQEETTGALFHVQVEQKIEREEAPKITGTNKDAEVEKKPYVRKGAKVGRNDPCPCESGKKFKNCHGRR